MILAELKPIFDCRKSFYGKARLVIEYPFIKLYSYNTLVCVYDQDMKECIDQDYSHHSYTTNRHVREFKKQVSEGYIS